MNINRNPYNQENRSTTRPGRVEVEKVNCKKYKLYYSQEQNLINFLGAQKFWKRDNESASWPEYLWLVCWCDDLRQNLLLLTISTVDDGRAMVGDGKR